MLPTLPGTNIQLQQPTPQGAIGGTASSPLGAAARMAGNDPRIGALLQYAAPQPLAMPTPQKQAMLDYTRQRMPMPSMQNMAQSRGVFAGRQMASPLPMRAPPQMPGLYGSPSQMPPMSGQQPGAPMPQAGQAQQMPTQSAAPPQRQWQAPSYDAQMAAMAQLYRGA